MTNAPTLQNPCCFGVSLQSGSKIIAVIEIILAILVLISVTIAFAVWGDESEGFPVAIWILMVVLIGVYLAFNILLFLGANQKNPKKVKIYLIFFCVALGFSILGFVKELFTWGNVAISFFSQFLFFYQGWVVYCFYKEIENEQPHSQQTC